MGVFTQRIEIHAEYGYVISNANVGWESMPQKVNIERPGIRVSNAPLKETGHIVADIDDYIELDDTNENMSPDFKTNYIRILHGELDNWKLMAIRIRKKCDITLAFVNVDTWREEDLHIKVPSYLRVTFEKELEDGTVDKYLLILSSEHGEQCSTQLTEYFSHSERVIGFEKRFSNEPECPDKYWDYAYVTEYR